MKLSTVTGLFSIALLVSAAGLATAAPVAVTNGSFEAEALDPGGWSDATPAGWVEPVLNGPDSFTEHLSPNFTPLDGTNHEGIVSGSWIAQDLGVPADANTSYALIVDIGHRSGQTVDGNQSRYELWAGAPNDVGSTLIAGATFDAFPLPNLTMVTEATGGDTGGIAPSGNLWVWLGSNGPGRAHFDNVRVDAELIPEPSSLALIGMAGAAFAGVALRRRRR